MQVFTSLPLFQARTQRPMQTQRLTFGQETITPDLISVLDMIKPVQVAINPDHQLVAQNYHEYSNNKPPQLRDSRGNWFYRLDLAPGVDRQGFFFAVPVAQAADGTPTLPKSLQTNVFTADKPLPEGYLIEQSSWGWDGIEPRDINDIWTDINCSATSVRTND